MLNRLTQLGATKNLFDLLMGAYFIVLGFICFGQIMFLESGIAPQLFQFSFISLIVGSIVYISSRMKSNGVHYD